MKRRVESAGGSGSVAGASGDARTVFKTPRLEPTGSGDASSTSPLGNGRARDEYLVVLYDVVNGWHPIVNSRVTAPDCPDGMVDRRKRLRLRIGKEQDEADGYVLSKMEGGVGWHDAMKTVEKYLEQFMGGDRFLEEAMDEDRLEHMTRGFPPSASESQPFRYISVGPRPAEAPISVEPTDGGTTKKKKPPKKQPPKKKPPKKQPPKKQPPKKQPPKKQPPPPPPDSSDSESESSSKEEEEEEEVVQGRLMEEWVAKLEDLTNAENMWRNEQQRRAAEERVERILGLVADGRLAEAEADYEAFKVQNEEERAAAENNPEEQYLNSFRASLSGDVVAEGGGTTGGNVLSFPVLPGDGLAAAAAAAAAALNEPPQNLPPGRVRRDAEDDPAAEVSILGPGGPARQPQQMYNTNTVDWDHYDYMTEGGRKWAHQLTRGGTDYGRPATCCEGKEELKALDEIEELQKRITDEQLKLVDRANALRYEMLDRKIQQIFLHVAHHTEAGDELKMARRGGTGARRRTGTLPADNERAKALKVQLQIPYTMLDSLEDGFGEEQVDKMGELWQVKLKNSGGSLGSIKNMLAEIIDPNLMNRLIWTSAHGTQSKPQLKKVYTRQLGISFSKISTRMMLFVERFIMQQSVYEELVGEDEKAELLKKYSKAVKSMFSNAKDTRLNQRRRLCYERVRDQEGDWRVSLLFLLDDQTRGKKLRGKTWPKGDGEAEKFVHTWSNKVESHTLEHLRKKGFQLTANSIEEHGPLEVVKMCLRKKLRKSWAPTDEDKETKALDARRKRERRREARLEQGTTANGNISEEEESGGDTNSEADEEGHHSDSDDVGDGNVGLEASQASRRSDRMRRPKKAFDV